MKNEPKDQLISNVDKILGKPYELRLGDLVPFTIHPVRMIDYEEFMENAGLLFLDRLFQVFQVKDGAESLKKLLSIVLREDPTPFMTAATAADWPLLTKIIKEQNDLKLDGGEKEGKKEDVQPEEST